MFDLLWSTPLRDIAASLGVSSPTIKKVTIAADIPTPPQGRWARIAAGKAGFPKPQLPLCGFGAPDDIWIATPYWDRHPRISPDDPIPPAPAFGEPIDSIRKRAAKAVGQIVMLRDLARTHPAIGHIVRDEFSRFEAMKTADHVFSWNKSRFATPIDLRRLRLPQRHPSRSRARRHQGEAPANRRRRHLGRRLPRLVPAHRPETHYQGSGGR
jgi:hypothetical protein